MAAFLRIKASKAEQEREEEPDEARNEALNGVSRVAIKRIKNMLLVISKPDVFKRSNSETYVFFGEAKIDDVRSQLQAQAAQQFRMPGLSKMMAARADASTSSAAAGEKQWEEEEEIDESGVEPRDIDLVMTLAGVSRAKS